MASAVSAAAKAAAPDVAAPAPATARSGLSSGLADVAATIRALPLTAGEPDPAVSPPAKKTPVAPPKEEAKPEAPKQKLAKAEPAKKAEPAPAKAASRHWVQIAGSAEKASLKGEFARLKAKAPKLLSGKTAWTSPLRFTNRLLVGPFKSEAEAQGFVNELAKVELAAFSWTSPAGQEIEKLSGK